MKKLIFFLFLILVGQLFSNQPVPYTGKVSIRGINYSGDAEFVFLLTDGNGNTKWKNGKNEKDTIKVSLRNGYYSVLLMNSLPPELSHNKLFLKD